MGIYVWGIGCGASQLIDRGFPPERVTAFVDRAPGDGIFLGRPVLLPEEIPVSQCDLLIVTIRHADAVAQDCARLGIPPERCLFLKNSRRLVDRNAASLEHARGLLGGNLLNKLLLPQHIVAAPGQLLQSRLLPDRKLYLFDSFQGFDPAAGAGVAMQAAHENTSVAQVLAALPYPEQAIIKPGFFPDSLNGLEERFCLVSLDVDFENTTLEGLHYFWPRLSLGGYLMLHDWGNPGLPGVAKALQTYQQELRTALPAVPIPDCSGTLVLYKL